MGSLPFHEIVLTEIAAGTVVHLPKNLYPMTLTAPIKAYICRWCKRTVKQDDRRRCHVNYKERAKILAAEQAMVDVQQAADSPVEQVFI